MAVLVLQGDDGIEVDPWAQIHVTQRPVGMTSATLRGRIRRADKNSRKHKESLANAIHIIETADESPAAGQLAHGKYEFISAFPQR